MLPALILTSILTFFFFGFNGEQTLDAAGMTGPAIAVRAGKSFCGLLMICGMTYGAQSLLDGEVPTIQSEERHEFASNRTFSAYVHDPLTATTLEDPATAFWYSTRQTPAPYINLDGTPWGHTAPDARKVEDPDAVQSMIIFTFFGSVVGLFVYLCFLILNKIFRLFFEGNWSQVHTQEAVGFHTLNINPVNPMPAEPSIKDSLDRILNAVRTTPTTLGVRPGSGDLDGGNRDNFETIRSEITSNNTYQSQVNGRLSTKMESMEERIDGRLQESGSEAQRSFGEIRRLVENLSQRYANDQSVNNTKDEDVRTRLQNLDAQVQALNGNVGELRINNTNTGLASMDTKIEQLIRLVDTQDLRGSIQTLNETVERLSNERVRALERSIEKVNKSVKAIDPSNSLETLEARYELLTQLVEANNADSKITAFGERLDRLCDQTSKALTTASPYIRALDKRVLAIQTQVTEVSLGLTDHNTSTERLHKITNQKVENLAREIQKANSKIDNYHISEAKIDEVQKGMKDSFAMTARQSEVQSVSKKLRDIQKELETVVDIPDKVQEIQKDVSKLSTLGGDVRSMTEQLGGMKEELQTIKPALGKVKVIQKEVSNLSSPREDVRSSNEQLDKMQQQINGIPGELKKLDKKIQNLVERNHDSILTELHANRCPCQNASVIMQEERPMTNNMHRNTQDLSKEIKEVRDEANRKHDLLAAQLEANRRNYEESPVKMQEESQTVNHMSEKFSDLDKKIQEVEDDLNQKHDSLVSQVEANQRTCQDTPERLQNLEERIQEVEDDLQEKHDSLVSQLEANQYASQKTPGLKQEEIPKTNQIPVKVLDFGQNIEDIQEVQQAHTSAVSKLEAGLRDMDNRLTSQETRADEIEKAHEERLDRHEESLSTHENSLNTLEDNMSNLRIDLDRIKEENEENPKAPRQRIGRAEIGEDSIKELVSELAKEAVGLYVANHWDTMEARLKGELHAVSKKLDVHLWEERFAYCQTLIGTIEESKCKCNLGGLEDRVGELEKGIEGSGCTCNPADLARNAADLESLKELMAENYAKLEKKVEDKLTTFKENLETLARIAENWTESERKIEGRITTLELNLDSFEEAKAKDEVQLEDVDGRLKGIEDQARKASDFFFQKFSLNLKSRLGDGQQEILDKRLKDLAIVFQKEGLGYAIRQFWDRVESIVKEMKILKQTVRGDSSVQPICSILEQLDTFQREFDALSVVCKLPVVQKALQDIDQAESRNSAFTQSYGQQTAPAQQTPAPVQSNAPTVPQTNPVSQTVSQAIFRHQLSDADDVPAEMRAILAHGPPREHSSVSYAYQSNQPIISTQTAPVQQYSPVLQTAMTPGWVSVSQQASPPYQPDARDNTVTQPNVSSPTASKEQTAEPQDKPVNVAGRKIKKPMSRRKSYQKQQQQLPSTDLISQPQQQQQQQQQQPAQQDRQDEQTPQPLKLEDIIDKSILTDTITTNDPETTAQPPSPPPSSPPLSPPSPPPSPPQMGPEAQAMLEAEEAERAQSYGTYDPLFDDVFDDIFDDDEINAALDEEERKEEERRNHPLSLPGNFQTVNVPETTQAERSEATAAQRPSQSQGGLSTQERGTVPEIQRDLPPPAETSKPVKASEEQKKADESVKQQNKQLNVSESVPKQTDNKPRGNSKAIPIISPEEKKKVDESVKQQNKPTNVTQSGPKQADKKPQGNTAGIPVKDSAEQKKEDDGYWQQALPPLPPVDKSLDWSKFASKQADNKSQSNTTSNPATISREAPGPVRPTRPASSPFLGQSKSRSQLTDRLRSAAAQSQGPSLSANRWAKEDDSAPNDKEVSIPAKASGEQKEKSQAAEQVSSKEEVVEGWNDPEIRHHAALEVLSSYKGTPLSASRWADDSEEKEEPSKKEKPRENVEKQTSGEKSSAAPARQKDKATSDNTSSTPAKGLDDRKIRHREVVEGSSIYKGSSLSASQWADESEGQKETAPTIKSEIRDSPAVRAFEKAYSNAKGKGKSADGTLPGTPDKWNQWATSTGGVKSSPAMTPSEREAERRAVKEAFATVKGTPLSASRWATNEDEKKDTVRTPTREAEGSPFRGRGSGGKYQVRDADLINRLPKPKNEHLIKFDRVKGKGEDVAAENNATSASAEGVREKNEASWTVPESLDTFEKHR